MNGVATCVRVGGLPGDTAEVMAVSKGVVARRAPEEDLCIKCPTCVL